VQISIQVIEYACMGGFSWQFGLVATVTSAKLLSVKPV